MGRDLWRTTFPWADNDAMLSAASPAFNTTMSVSSRRFKWLRAAAGRRKVPAVSGLSAPCRRLWNRFSPYQIILYCRAAWCIHPSFFNLSPFLSFVGVRRLPLNRRHHSGLWRGSQSVKKGDRNTWRCVHTLFSSAYSDPFRLIWDLNRQGK